MDPVPAYQLIDASVRFGDLTAVMPTSLSIADGDHVALVGPSGSGKSTLIRMLAGLQRPTTGRVHYRGKPMDGIDLAAFRRSLGFVIQEGGLFPHLSAHDNITLVARWQGQSRDQCERRVAELREFAQLPADVLDRFPAELSGGQRQRVALMRALMLDPDVLLLDEPLGALDPLVRADLQEDLRSLFQSLDKTVVLVTHDMNEARYLADRMIIMHDGQVDQDGTIEDVMTSPATDFVRKFLGVQVRGSA